MGLIILSFDAVCDDDLEFLLRQKNFAEFAKRGSLVRETDSVFITNTYPAHCSVITGNLPNKHGVIENTLTQPDRESPDWYWYRKYIKTTTLYDEASKQGLVTCAVLWPVTAGAKIKYNLPEIFSPIGKNQLLVSLKAGSKLFQLACLFRHVKKLKGVSQPNLDNFAFASALDAAKHRKPDLILLHLTDVDHHKHNFGPKSNEAENALKRLDSKLGALMKSCPEYEIIIFGDHGCLPISDTVNLNALPGLNGAYWHQAGGCAFLKRLHKAVSHEDALKYTSELTKNPAARIRRILDKSEMAAGGFDKKFLLGIEAEAGFCFGKEPHLGQHGYSLQNDRYKTFYAAMGKNIRRGHTVRGGGIIDIAPLAAKMLNIPLWETDGKLNMEVLT